MTHIKPSLVLRPNRCRFVVGLAVSSSCRQIRATLLAAAGHALDLRLEVAAALVRPVPARLVREFRRLRHAGKCQPARAAVLAAELAELEALLVDDLLAPAPHLGSRVLAIGVTEPGLWTRPGPGLTGYVPLSDSARLADLTGLNVIDAFPARDLAQDGRGGPLGPLPDWLLLHHSTKTRAVVELGSAVRITYLPAARDSSGAHRVASFVAGPGLRLPARIARELAAKPERTDPLPAQPLPAEATPAEATPAEAQAASAPQSQVNPTLLAEWLADPTLAAGDAHAPLGTFAVTGLLRAGLQNAAGRWPSADLLPTALHLIAEVAARAIDSRLPLEPGVDEVIVTGAGQRNDLLMRAFAERLTPRALVRLPELGLAEHARDGAIAGALALLHLDQTPACPTAISGAHTPRVLGRLTPGSPQVWQRLLRELATSGRNVLSLRSAI